MFQMSRGEMLLCVRVESQNHIRVSNLRKEHKFSRVWDAIASTETMLVQNTHGSLDSEKLEEKLKAHYTKKGWTIQEPLT